jgi:ribonucleotide reductase beta subunit family protein with ferritin-like domain
MVESKVVDKKKQQKNRPIKKVNHIKMKVINSVSWNEIKFKVNEHVDPNASATTDG